MGKVDNYEIQQYMIEQDGDEWRVRDTHMEISISYHPTREEAVEACRDLRDPEGAKLRKLKVVRLYDGFDRQWMDVSKPVPEDEAQRIWNEKTKNGTERTKYADIDYYAIFPADTRMLYSEGYGEI